MERILEHRSGLRAAIVLAGGRGSRLGGADKATLELDGLSLLERAILTLAFTPAGEEENPGAEAIAVVGPESLRGRVQELAAECGIPIVLTREEPAFAGPAAAVAAGLAALDRVAPDAGGKCFVLAVDYARPGRIVPILRRAAGATGPRFAGRARPAAGLETAGAWVPQDESGRDQPLASVWDLAGLRRAVSGLRDEGRVANASMKQLLARVVVSRTTMADLPGHVTADLFADVDTWDDAAHAGITLPTVSEQKPHLEDHMAVEKPLESGGSEHPELDAWARELMVAYGLEDAPVDVERILSLAGEAAHSIVRPAAPLTTWIAGYAAGLAAARSESGGENAAAEADALARRVIADRTDG
ncbi:DUF6457 domain-containing protein [Zhihengliuella halotolerans]|uniref:DUF6457 domain-containing protein n=1 Tax=Zhihengliuella halotolerans TaxID=370736 RepID=UPI000C809B67|nr:DUF6457 domain-containing protein [Zhihengliuella halotolerans]